MTKISAVINTYNAVEYLPEVIEALKDFDEVVVCDMESTDATVEVGRQLGAKVVTFPRGSYNYCEPARQFAIDSASNDWVLVVDADEIVTPPLTVLLRRIADESQKAAAEGSDDVVRGALVPRLNFVIGRPDMASYPDYQLRFLNRRYSRWPVEIHSRPIVDGNVIALPAKDKAIALLHKSHPLSGIMERMNRYTSAEVAKRSGEGVSLFGLIFKPWFRFVKSFLLKGGWRNGIAGYICARNEANYKFYTLAKLFESRGVTLRPK